MPQFFVAILRIEHISLHAVSDFAIVIAPAFTVLPSLSNGLYWRYPRTNLLNSVHRTVTLVCIMCAIAFGEGDAEAILNVPVYASGLPVPVDVAIATEPQCCSSSYAVPL